MLIPFDNASLSWDGDRLILTVTGQKSTPATEVELVPMVYVHRPDYWAIQVHGKQDGPSPDVLTPYTETLDVSSTVGHNGLIVQGSDEKIQQLETPSKAATRSSSPRPSSRPATKPAKKAAKKASKKTSKKAAPKSSKKSSKKSARKATKKSSKKASSSKGKSKRKGGKR